MADANTLTSTLTIIDESSKVLNAIESASVSASAALDQLITRLSVVSGIKLTDVQFKGLDDIANNINKSLNTSGDADGTKDIEKDIENIGNEAEKTQGKTQGAFSKMAEDIAHVTQAAQGVFTVLSKIGNMAVGAISKGDDIAKTARALHINAQAYQELDYAAQRGGASHEQYVQSLKVLDKQLAQLQGGSKEVASAFKQIGISQKDLSGKDLEGSLYAISDALGKMEDRGKAAKVAQTLLGTQGYKTAEAFAVGAEELDKLRQEARETGAIMDDMTLDLAENGADELLNVQLQIQSIWQKISVAVMPTVVKVLEKIDALFKENADTINQIAAFVGQLADEVLPVVMQLIGIIMRNVQNVFSFVMPYIPQIMDFIGLVTEGIGILVDKFGDVIVVVGGVVAALMAVKTVMLAIAANPIMAIIAGAVAIISLILAMQKESEEFYAVCTKIGIGIAMVVDTVVSSIIGSLQTAGNAIGRVWNFITGFIMEAFGKALGKLADLWNSFMDWIGIDSLKIEGDLGGDIEKSGSDRKNDALDLSKDFYFDASGTFDGLADRLSMGLDDMGKTGRELGWTEPTKDIVDAINAQTQLNNKGTNDIINTMHDGVKIDKDSILFMKEMATAEVINRYNEFSPNITQSFNSNQPFEPGQIETLSGSAIDGAMNRMRSAI
ncbi:MAG: hypothetical protein IJU23_12030 [Proteobacteria bacterium]|nr:hypothetical protein [Pseudomonadota bacterium]